MQKYECQSCSGTGLYRGFAEPKGTAVVCCSCKGTGQTENGKVLFSGVKKKVGVERVYVDGGMWMFRSDKSKTISIEEFEKIRKKDL